MIANLPAPDPSAFWQFILSAAAIMLIIERGMAMVTRWRGSAVDVRLTQDMVNREQLAQHEAYTIRRISEMEDRLSTVESKIEQGFRDVHKAGEARATKIHDRINLVVEKLGELKGRIDER